MFGWDKIQSFHVCLGQTLPRTMLLARKIHLILLPF